MLCPTGGTNIVVAVAMLISQRHGRPNAGVEHDGVGPCAGEPDCAACGGGRRRSLVMFTATNLTAAWESKKNVAYCIVN